MGEVRSKREACVGNEWGGIKRGTGVDEMLRGVREALKKRAMCLRESVIRTMRR